MAEIICPKCKSPNRGTAQFCSECGTPLLSGTGPRETTPARVPPPPEEETLIQRRENILQNRYRIEEQLGQGGFGSVYRAWDLNLNRVCAIKENLAVSADAQRQFMREATVLANLSHSNLPRVIDHFIVPERGQYLVMDYVAGEDLESMLARDEIIPVDTALRWILQVADGLEYLHRQQPPIFHRDVKPANIRVTPNDQAMLVDFGLVKVFDAHNLTTQGARAITPGYAPPEQYGRGGTDARTDIYALGATLYMLVTGHEPLESVRRMVGEHLPSAHSVNPEVPLPVSDAIERAMALDPAGRFLTVAEFRRTLQSAQSALAQAGRKKDAATVLVEPAGEVPAPPPQDARKGKASAPVPLRTERMADNIPMTTVIGPGVPPAAKPVNQPGKGGTKWLGLAIGGVIVLVACLGLSAVLATYFFRDQGDPVEQTLTARVELNDPVQATLTARVQATLSAAGGVEATSTRPPSAANPTAAAPASTHPATNPPPNKATATQPTGSNATEKAREKTLTDLFESAALIYGPKSGRILHKAENGFIETISASVGVRNFITDVTFVTPYSVEEGDWDFGVLFRRGESNVQYRLVFLSDKSWILTNHTGSSSGETVAEGVIEGMNTGAGESNSVLLYAIEGKGYLYFNEEFISELDISTHYSGGIMLGIGFYDGTEKTGKLTEYKDFSVWKLPIEP